MAKTSQVSGFYKLKREERLSRVAEFAGLTDQEAKMLEEGLGLEQAEKMVENVVATFRLPLGMAMNFLINGKEYMIPMATEETSVVAAASNAAKLCRPAGGFKAESTEPIMTGQIQLLTKDPKKAKNAIEENKKKILELANTKDPRLISLGGGAKDLEARIIKTGKGEMVIIHLYVDVKDAMGANAVNTMCEAVSPLIEELSGGKTLLKIISNLADRRLARSEVTVGKEELGGEEVVDAIIDAYEFAAADPYRAVTHNKGAMNGITAATIATGNDSRAVEAGAHAFAARQGRYTTITTWEKDRDGDLHGRIELPLAVGIVGGATMNPSARVNLKILGVKTAKELSEVIASVGLAQNLAALRALSTEGIQRGHMSLHAKNIAMMAGAKGVDIERVADAMVKEKNINVNRAKELLEAKQDG
jgi:hydroxymethylglutaryl-CoA reductase